MEELKIPDFIGNYKVIEIIGGGCGGIIFSAELGGMKFAIKRVSMLRVITLFEISFYKVLSHPNIVLVNEIIFEKEYAYIVMSMMDKELDLRNLNEERSRILLYQILSVLNYLHDNGVYHNDTAPNNIMMKGTQIYMIDFELATFRKNSIINDQILLIDFLLLRHFGSRCPGLFANHTNNNVIFEDFIKSSSLQEDLKDIILSIKRGNSLYKILNMKYFSGFIYHSPNIINFNKIELQNPYTDIHQNLIKNAKYLVSDFEKLNNIVLPINDVMEYSLKILTKFHINNKNSINLSSIDRYMKICTILSINSYSRGLTQNEMMFDITDIDIIHYLFKTVKYNILIK